MIPLGAWISRLSNLGFLFGCFMFAPWHIKPVRQPGGITFFLGPFSLVLTWGP